MLESCLKIRREKVCANILPSTSRANGNVSRVKACKKIKLRVALCLEANYKFDADVNAPLQPFLTALNDKDYFWQPVK